jgi:hypothetical protein
MEESASSKMLLLIYQTTRRHIPERPNLDTLECFK